MSLKILAIADQVSSVLYDHFQRERWSDIDVVLSCGDLPPEYLDFLASSLNVPVLYVRGNHDWAFERDRYDGSDNLHGKIIEYRGVRFAGFEGSRRYNHGGCQYTEAEMRRVVRRTRLRGWRSPPDVVLTHSPPAGIHDGPDYCHTGFQCFRDAMDVWRPEYFVHGHTHAYERGEMITDVAGTTVLNAYPYHVFQVARRLSPVA